jgi:DNA processing protein
VSDLTDGHVAGVALLGLSELGPVRYRRLVVAFGGPERALAAVRAGEVAHAFDGDGRARGLTAQWKLEASARDLEALRAFLERRGTRAVFQGEPAHPIDDEHPDVPPVLLIEGTRDRGFDRPRVAVVGTRAASPHGLQDAYDLGADLARAGVTVVSGLAIGVDGAAHEGALDAGGNVIGVIGTGLDQVYPRRHSILYQRVRDSGVLVSEHAFGVGPRPAHFPIRNRIIALLADVVVVVEGTVAGGTRSTADKGFEYGRTVMAVPGSRRNPAAAGCNQLIADGALPVLDNGDVLTALGMTPGSRRSEAADSVGGTPEEQQVMTALAGEPATVDEITSRTELLPGGVAVAVAGLVRSGRALRANGLVWPM